MVVIILLSAIALVLVIEGIMPFVAPQVWRRFMLEMAARSDRQMRIIGLVLLVLGAAIMILVHWGILY